ncbi:MAG: PAS domain-containing protein [Hyphomicrobiales bacterium]|nr:PAS domain-containing protein [Hyphomicrobiales bacterium]
MMRSVVPTGVERVLGEGDIVVSKTDLKGDITYANDVFCRIAGYSEEELIGAPHSIIRHPDMPRCVFKFLWDTLGQGKEVFAYVVNLCKNGDHYWVFAHVTPSYDNAGNIIGYHSFRRSPKREVVFDVITPLYATLLAEEAKHRDRKAGMAASMQLLVNVLTEKETSYEELILSL